MGIELELQIASDAKMLPHPAQIREWVSLTLWQRLDNAELTIRIVDEEESAHLNFQYRNKRGATNVLSFPYKTLPNIKHSILGDIVICAPVVAKEAAQQGKSLLSHWAHMVIHGILHLLGFNHELDPEANEMETLETALMIKLGFPPPYGEILLT